MPPGMPLNLIGGLELASETPGVMDQVKHTATLLDVLWKVRDLFLKTGDPAERARTFERSQSEFLNLDKCPDFVVNRGHYFGTDQFQAEPGLSDTDKEALIAFLKTF
jgi:hypothetical protein